MNLSYCKHGYSVGEYVTVDEMLPEFSNRNLNVYIPSKPNKYGIKYGHVELQKHSCIPIFKYEVYME